MRRKQTELEATLAFAIAFMEKHDFNQANVILLKCLTISQEERGNDSHQTIGIKEKIGVCFYRLNNYVAALSYLRPVYLFRQTQRQISDLQLLYAAKYLGLSLTDAGHHEEAIPILSSALDSCVSIHGANSNSALLLKSRLSTSLKSTRNWQQLVDLHQTTDEKVDDEPKHLLKLRLAILRNIAAGYSKLDGADHALRLIFNVLKLTKERLGVKRVEFLDDLRFASIIMMQLRRHDEAEDLLQKAIELSDNVFGPNSKYRTMVMRELELRRETVARRLEHEKMMAEHEAARAAKAATIETA